MTTAQINGMRMMAETMRKTTIMPERAEAIGEATHLVTIALNELRAAINGQGEPAAAFWRLIDAAGLLASAHDSAGWVGLNQSTGRGYSLRIDEAAQFGSYEQFAAHAVGRFDAESA